MSSPDLGALDISPGEIRTQADRLLANPRFASAERQRRFLEFIIGKVLAGQSDDIKEYAIALEVYGRKPEYDPKVDSIVRVEASRVRARLKEYYDTDGKADPIIIELPKGSYVPAFRRSNGLMTETVSDPIPVPAPPPPPPAVSPRRPVGVVIGIVAAGLVLVGFLAWTRSRVTNASVQSIRVVPFTILVQDKAQDALVKGLAKDIESEITQLGRLQVVSQDPKTKPADLVLEGTIRDDGGKPRVVAQLMSSHDGGYIWSQVFHDENDKLARSVATQVEIQAVRYAQERAASGTPRGRALALFRAARGLPTIHTDGMMLRGTATIERMELSELNRSINLLEQTVAADPSFAPAHSSLSSFYTVAAEYDSRMLVKARERAKRAIELEPRMGEAHANLAYIYFLYDWNLPAAATEFRLSLEYEPRILTSSRMCADVLNILGHSNEALQVLDRARMVYPNHPVVETSVAVTLFNSGRFAEAEALARRNAARFPDYHLSHWILGIALEQLNRKKEATEELEQCLKMSRGDSRCTVAAGYLYAVTGQREKAQKVLAQYKARPDSQSKSLYAQALIHNGLGETELAYADLEAAAATREFDVPYCVIEPRFANLRSQPRFQAILQKAGLKF